MKAFTVPLSRLDARPAQYQFRETPFSTKTVAAIVAEGLDLAKYDPIPVIDAGGGRYVVGGAGHSRHEAIKRLAAKGKLPTDWVVATAKRGVDWLIPARLVTLDQARDLAETENFSRDAFTPAAQARVFQAMVDRGLSIAAIAKRTHTSEVHVVRTLTYNSLAQDIRAMIGVDPAAGGIDVLTAHVLAVGFKRYGIGTDTQQHLWHCFLKGAMLNFQTAKRMVDRLGTRLAQREKGDDLLFAEAPPNVAAVLSEAKARGSAFRTAKMGLSLLVKAHELGALADFPELAAWVGRRAGDAIDQLAARVAVDGDLLADMIAPPEQWGPLPKTAADDKIARQYDPAATPTFC